MDGFVRWNKWSYCKNMRRNLSDMKLKGKSKILLFTLMAVLLFSIVINDRKDYKIEILKNMKNGLEDESIVDYYWEYIQGAEEISVVPITIRYFDIDLNKDGTDDKIVILIAPILFSASHGDTVEILINENGKYRSVFSGVFKINKQDKENTPAGKIYILKNIENGFYKIKILGDQTEVELIYDKNEKEYEMYLMDSI